MVKYLSYSSIALYKGSVILVSIVFETFFTIDYKSLFRPSFLLTKNQDIQPVYVSDLQIVFLISFKIIGSLNFNPILVKRFKIQNTGKSI